MDAVIHPNIDSLISHHVSAFVEGNIDELMQNFTEESRLITPEGALQGRLAIRTFYESVFKIIPKGSLLEIKQRFVNDDIAYLAWSCDSPFVTVPLGSESFVITNGKISVQTLALHVISK